jgi:hypothetical protein
LREKVPSGEKRLFQGNESQPPSDGKAGPQRRIGATIFIGVFALLVVGLGIDRLTKGCSNAGVGLLALGALFLGFTALSLLPASPVRRTRPSPKPTSAMNASTSDAMVEVMRSTDPIVVEVLRGKLIASGISAEIVDEQSSRMLGHLPVIPLRLMVPRDELPRCGPILEEEEDGA